MEEIINIIKEIKKMEQANDELKVNPIRDERAVTHYETIENKLTNEVVATKENVKEVEKEYDNSKEGNLLRELDETRDVYRRKELIEQIKQVRIEKMKDLQRQLNRAKANISKNVEQNKQLIEANKNEMYRMKANRDKLKDENGIIRAEWQNAYVEMTKQIMEKRNENIELNKNVKEMEALLKDIRERKFDKILTENSSDNQKPAEQKPAEQKPAEQKPKKTQIEKEEDLAWNAKEKKEAEEEAIIAEQTAKEIEEWDKEEDKREQEELNQKPAEQKPAEQKPTEQKPGITQGFINQLNEEASEEEILTPEISNNSESVNVNEEQSENKITVHAHTVDIRLPGYKFTLDLDYTSEEEKETLNNLSKETLEKIHSTEKFVDGAVVRALLVNEKMLNDYLDLCEIYSIRNDKDFVLDSYELSKVAEKWELPEIEYDFRDLRKNESLTLEQKMEKYVKAKEIQKMFNYIDEKKKVNIKMSLADKVYFGWKGFTSKLTKKALPPAQQDNTHEVVQNANTEPEKTTSVKHIYRVSNLPPVKRPTEPTKTTEKTDGSR